MARATSRTTKTAAKKTAAKKKATKKTATKKAASKPATSTSSQKARKPAASRKKEDKPPSRAERLRALEAKVNKPKGPVLLKRASQSDSAYLLRRPTGITSLDIKLAGGFPASAPSVITGPDGAGKDTLLWLACAEQQRIHGEDFALMLFLTEFRLDKPYMRKCGFKVAFTDGEIAEINESRKNAALPPLSPEERADLKTEVGTITLVEAVTADQGLDIIVAGIEQNAFQIVAINSIGSLQTMAKEAAESLEDSPQQSNEAILLTKFATKIPLALNGEAYGERNRTCVLALNQVRARRDPPRAMKGRPTQEKDKYKPAAEAWGFKHGKAIDLMLHKGKAHYDKEEKRFLGRVVKWELTKGKLGTHDGISGEYNFYYDAGVDVVGDLLTTAVEYEVVSATSNGWFTFEDVGTDLYFKGMKADARRAIMESEDLRQRMRYLCFQKAGVVYRHT